MRTLRKFSGNNTVSRKLNDMVDVLNRLQNIRGDGLIQVSQTPAGVGVGLSVQQLLPKIPKPQDTWVARVIDGRDEGLPEYWWSLDEPGSSGYGWYVDEVPVHSSGFLGYPPYHPTRTRTADNTYIPTICVCASGSFTTFWGCTKDVLLRLNSDPFTLTVPPPSGYPTYTTHNPLDMRPHACYAKITSAPKSTVDYMAGDWCYFEGVFSAYTSGGEWYDFDGSAGKSLSILWFPVSDNPGSSPAHAYPSKLLGRRVPVFPTINGDWMLGPAAIPLLTSSPKPGGLVSSPVVVDPDYGDYGAMWTTDNT